MGSGHVEGGRSGGHSDSWAGSQSTSAQGSAAAGQSYGQSTGAQDVWGAQAPALQDLYGAAAALMLGQGQYGRGAEGVAARARSAWADQLTPGGNPYFEKSVQGAIDQATQGFTRDVLPELDARGVGVGQYGGERDSLARGQAAGQFGAGLSQQVAGLYANQYATDQQRAAAALGQSGNVQAMQMAPLTTAAGIVGGPTVLGRQQSTSGSTNQATSWGTSNSQSAARSASSNFGWNAGSGGSFMSKGE